MGPVTLIFILSVFSHTSPHENDCRKIIFLYAGWCTHLLRFHGERPYHVRVESQVVVSLGASEFCLPLKACATLQSKNVFESGIAFMYCTHEL